MPKVNFVEREVAAIRTDTTLSNCEMKLRLYRIYVREIGRYLEWTEGDGIFPHKALLELGEEDF